jgi:UDP-MurNAc hydroxylase
MQMEWVNHASFILRSGSVSLLHDPWLEGTALNDGWRLLSPTKFSYSDFASITHIWFSNEHPDHFNPSNLSKVPEEYRRTITVLFHYTKDKRLVSFCRSIGFQAMEIPEGNLWHIAPDFKLLCGMQGLIDSWLAVFADGQTLLNLNDCAFESSRELEKIKQKVGDISVLMSQFSYDNWVGNPEDSELHQKHAARKIEEMSRQIQIFRPAQFIPFASYIFFCHAENSHMNLASNRIGDVFHRLVRELNMPTVVLYPGDRWTVGGSHDSTQAIHSYNEDFNRAWETQPAQAESIDLDSLMDAAENFISESSEKNDQLLLNALPPAVIYLLDLDTYVELSFRSGLKVVDQRQADIKLSSDSLLNCLTTEGRGETLVSNGRFQVPIGGRPRRFFWIFRVPRHSSISTTVDLRFLGRHTVEKTRTVAGGR